jgi:D-glycero-alpha-D-manno-heptose-7-phosphate kinase
MMSEKSCLVEVPARVDLAGGTLDLWPLYNYFGGLELVQMSIQVKARTHIVWSVSKSWDITVESLDLRIRHRHKTRQSLTSNLELSPKDNPLRWLERLVSDATGRYQGRPLQMHITTASDCPPGSGLGGSSVLGVSLSRALEKSLRLKPLPPLELQTRIRDLEAIEIGYPAGEQDYIPALIPGLNVVHLSPGTKTVETLSKSLAAKLSQRLALIYVGKPHHSGINNWAVFKALHEGNKKTQRSLQDIQKISQGLASDLRQGRLDRLSEWISAEWKARKELSPAVNAKELESAWRWGKSKGAVACKACGAGGGGTLLLVFKNQNQRDKALEASLPSKDWFWLPV